MPTVEIAYANAKEQALLTVEISPDVTIKQAIIQSGILEKFSDIDLDENTVGIFGHIQPLDTVLRGGDRVEIYRPLLIDPKDARRLRAKRKKA